VAVVLGPLVHAHPPMRIVGDLGAEQMIMESCPIQRFRIVSRSKLSRTKSPLTNVLGSAERLVNLLGRFRPDLLHKDVENALVRACQISAPSLPSGAGHWHKAHRQNRKTWYTAGGFCESTQALTHIAFHPARSSAPLYRDCQIACFEESAAEEFGELCNPPTLILRAHQFCQCAPRKYMHLSTQVRTNSGRPIFTACSEALCSCVVIL
jgi:hypothetical protein